MASILIQSVTIVHPGHKLNAKKRDILIERGKVTEIATKIKPSKTMEVITEKDLHISIGWIDMAARFCDPGHEYKEDLHSGLKAAAKGGFSAAVVLPDTEPCVDSKSGIEYVINKSRSEVCQALPAGAISQGMKGKQLAEFYDMTQSGAVAFTDDKRGVDHTELMHRALEYGVNFDALVYSFPFDKGVVPGGIMHEGSQSTLMGTKAIPTIGETIRLQRDIELLSHAGGKMHALCLSSAESIDLIKQAKKRKLNITASVAAHHLMFTDKSLAEFDSNYKVLPPLREESDRKALIKGLKSGTIDCIVSDHTPEDVEHKKVELAHAAYGMNTIESAFAMARTATKGALEIEDLVRALALSPRKILSLSTIAFEEGAEACFTLFQPNEKIEFDTAKMLSKTDNTPLHKRTLLGKVVGVINGSRHMLDH